jgi:spore coat polysaccharide biosynthesis protein SpsF
MDFCGKPMLLFQINLLENYNLHTEIVVATSHNSLDDKIVSFCKEHGIKYVRGSENNVFKRFQRAAENFNFDHIVRLTGDNPLTNYRVIKACLEKHIKNKPDITSTRKVLSDHTVVRFAPKGNSVDVIDCRTLLTIDSDHLSSFEKEHVIPVFFNGKYCVSYVKINIPDAMSFSIDNQSDLERVSQYARDCIARNTLLQNVGFRMQGKVDKEE